jgi:CRP-like cAMP-binding protein
MVPLTEIKRLKLFEQLPASTLEVLAKDIESLEFETGDYIVSQHDEARAIYILLSGAVQFLMMVEGMDDFFVGTTSERGALIGWSVVREPFRYTASVRCTEPCRVFKLRRAALDRVLRKDPIAACRILRAVAAALVDRLEDARELLGQLPKTGPHTEC